MRVLKKVTGKTETEKSLIGKALGGLLVLAVVGCSPTVRLEAPKEPIQINMNVKIEQEVRVRVERDLEDEFAANPALFGVPAAAVPNSMKKGKR